MCYFELGYFPLSIGLYILYLVFQSQGNLVQGPTASRHSLRPASLIHIGTFFLMFSSLVFFIYSGGLVLFLLFCIHILF